MEQSSAVWLIILLALITANLPFAIQRPLLLLPLQQAGGPARPLFLRWLESLLFFALLGSTAWLFYTSISNMLILGGGVSSLMFIGLIIAYLASCIALMGFAGWRLRAMEHKSFAVRLLEVLVLYALCGTLAMALEQNIGNRFAQTWEFYAITGSLYAVLGYPGFVVRYLLRKPRRRRAGAGSQSGRGTRPATSKTVEQPVGYLG